MSCLGAEFVRATAAAAFCLLMTIWMMCVGATTVVNGYSGSNIRWRPERQQISGHNQKVVESLVRQWAPLVWLAPGEQFMPGNVNDFLRNVHAEKSTLAAPSVLHQTADILEVSDDVLLYELDREIGISESQQQQSRDGSKPFPIPSASVHLERVIDLPIGKRSLDWFLTANSDVDAQLTDDKSFLYGQDPNRAKVPIYAVMKVCESATNQRPTMESLSENDIQSSDRYERTSYIPIVAQQDEATVSSLIGQRSRTRTNMSTSAWRHRPKRDSTAQSIVVDSTGSTNPISDPSLNESIPPPTPPETLKTIYSRTDRLPQFHVTYWMFYPYNQGKTLCSLNLGPLGRLPIPQLFGKCLGTRRDFGSHVGDWEHMTLYFRSGNRREPSEMYVSAHDAGAYYTYDRLTGSFEFRRQETRNNHILQQPVFPKTVRTVMGQHPVLFSALGSHGLWTAPGQHRFVRVPRLVDVNGFGTPWYTWKNIEFSYDRRNAKRNDAASSRDGGDAGRSVRIDGPEWLQYMGRWGNAKSKCHPLKRLGLNLCEYNDGPTGIPLKESHFVCSR